MLSEDELAERCAKYAEIASRKETASEADARRYWLEFLADPIIDRAREKLKKAGRLPKVDLLVSVGGFSPETTIITIGVFEPSEVFVVVSDRTRDMIDVIAEFARKRRIPSSRFEHVCCEPTDFSLFDAIYKRVTTHRIRSAESGGGAKETETLIDITGGKKIMSAAAATAAWEFDLRICYVDNKYEVGRRSATPGTENIVLLESPYSIYGGTELRRADRDFNLGAYDAAHSGYERLADRLNEPGRARFLRDLSAVYDAWRNLNISRLNDSVRVLRGRVDDASPFARAYRDQIRAQIRLVERLVEKDPVARIMTLFLLGDANMEWGRYDFSALLFYRTIEATISSRLEQEHAEFECENPEYSKLGVDVGDLEQRYQAVVKELRPKSKEVGLPEKVACIDGAILLQVLRDPLLVDAGLADASALKKLGGLTTARNRSILAHGFNSVEKKDCEKLREPAVRLLAAYWALKSEQPPFEEALRDLRFVRLEE